MLPSMVRSMVRWPELSMKPAPTDHVGDPIGSTSAFNVPNALTVVRLLLVPVFAWLLLRDDGMTNSTRIAAFAVFLVASLTDFVDGEIARRRNLVTTFGKIVDPIADKALTGVALIGLSLLGLLAWWVTAVILIREIGVTLLRFWVIRHGVIPASRGGKAKTVAQMVAIGLYVLPLSSSWDVVRALAMTVAVALTLGTGIDYIARALTLRRSARAVA